MVWWHRLCCVVDEPSRQSTAELVIIAAGDSRLIGTHAHSGRVGVQALGLAVIDEQCFGVLQATLRQGVFSNG
jgi:RecG-like helicase